MLKKIKVMFSVFDRRQKGKIVYLTFILLMDAFVELLGVTAILPFIDAILQPEILTGKPIVRDIMDRFSLDVDHLIVAIAIAIIIIYILKNLFLLYMSNLQYKFSYYGKRDLGNRFMKCYIRQDYSFHLKHNSAEMMRDISGDVDMFYTTVLNFMQLITEMVIAAVLIAYLFVTDILITIGVACALSFMLLFFMGSYKKTLVRLGEERRHYQYKMTQGMQQGFGGIKEIKIANQEDFFVNEFADANNRSSEALRKNVFLNAVPKPVMEALCIAGLMTVISIKILNGTERTSFVSTLAVFAVAAFKLLPSVNKISGYIGNVFHNGVVIDTVADKVRKIEELEKQEKEADKSGRFVFNSAITLKDLTYRYPETDVDILRDVSLEIQKNESVAFVGPSGAGKTTSVDVILGLLIPSTGQVCVDNRDIMEDVAAWRRLIGYIPQTIYMLDDTIRNNVTFGEKRGEGDDEVWHALEEARLADFVRSLPEGLDTMIGEAGVRISGGQRQRIGIARALYRRPEILVLDEATSALDTETEKAVMESIEDLQGKLTMIIIAHRLSTIEHCDKVYEVKDGTITRQR